MIKQLYLYILVITLISSCNVDQLDVEGLKLSENKGLYAFPIGETTYQLMELLDDADTSLEIDTDDNGMISFSFEESDTIALAEESTNQGVDLAVFLRQAVNFPTSSFNIPFFETFEGGSFLLENPNLNFSITNELRMPIAIALEIYGTKTNDDGDTLRKELEIYDSFFDFNDSLKLITNPSLTDTAAALTLITLDKTSSDFDQFLGWTPENIYMNMSMVANPDLPADSILIFLPPDSIPDREFNEEAQIFTKMSLDLPISLHLDNLVVPVNLDSITVDVDLATIDSIQLRVVTYNMLPFGALLNLQFLDLSGEILHSLEEDLHVLANPNLNSITFNIKEPEININQFWLNREGVNALNDTKTIKIIMTINTTDGAPNIYTPLLEEYKLEVKISGKVRLSYDL